MDMPTLSMIKQQSPQNWQALPVTINAPSAAAKLKRGASSPFDKSDFTPQRKVMKNGKKAANYQKVKKL